MEPHTTDEGHRTIGSQGPDSVWTRLTGSERRFVLLAFTLGLALVLATTAWWALDLLARGGSGDGILFPPMVFALGMYTALVGIASVLPVRAAGADREIQGLARLGAVWALASIPLMFDYLLDSFPGKLLVNALFLVVGIRAWKGLRNSFLSLFLAPLTALIAVADGLGHMAGSFCAVGRALDACPAKAVSDFYLVMLLVVVTAVTLRSRTQRPDPKKTLLYGLVLVGILLAFAFGPF